MNRRIGLAFSLLRRRIGVMAFICLLPFLGGCRLIALSLAAIGIGTAAVGYGTYQAVRLTGRAASNAAGATVNAVGTVTDRTLMRLDDAAEAGGRLGEKLFAGGELTFTLNDDVYHVWNATARALSAMNFREIATEYDSLSGWGSAKTIDDRDVRIDFRQQAEYRTEVKIRVGLRGDEDASRLIQEKITTNLGYPSLPPEPLAPR